MRNTITLALVAVTGLALSAQTPAPSSPSQSSPPSSASSTPRRVTVTGCLEAGPNNTYTLVAAAPSEPSTSGTSGTAGTTGSATTGSSGSTGTTAPTVKTVTYLLSPSVNVDLKGNAGHQVKVTGTEMPAQSVASETDRTATPEKPQGTSGTPVVKTTEHAQIVARQLSVSSVSTVASKCDILK